MIVYFTLNYRCVLHDLKSQTTKTTINIIICIHLEFCTNISLNGALLCVACFGFHHNQTKHPIDEKICRPKSFPNYYNPRVYMVTYQYALLCTILVIDLLT